MRGQTPNTAAVGGGLGTTVTGTVSRAGSTPTVEVWIKIVVFDNWTDESKKPALKGFHTLNDESSYIT